MGWIEGEWVEGVPCEDAPCCGCCGHGVYGDNDPEPDPYEEYLNREEDR